MTSEDDLLDGVPPPRLDLRCSDDEEEDLRSLACRRRSGTLGGGEGVMDSSLLLSGGREQFLLSLWCSLQMLRSRNFLAGAGSSLRGLNKIQVQQFCYIFFSIYPVNMYLSAL